MKSAKISRLSLALALAAAICGCKRREPAAQVRSEDPEAAARLFAPTADEVAAEEQRAAERRMFPATLATRADKTKFLNLDPALLPDDSARLGLRYALWGVQFNYRIPYYLLKAGALVGATKSYTPDIGMLPSPYQLHKDTKLALGFGYFDGLDGSKLAKRDAYVNLNCFGCHASMIGDTVVGGAGNKDLDLSTIFGGQQKILNLADNAVARKALQLATNPEVAAAVTGYTRLLNNVVVPILGHGRALGDNQGAFISLGYGAFLKKQARTMDDTDDATMPSSMFKTIFCPTCALPPAHAMPWWLVKYKKKHYWFGDSTTEDSDQQAMDFVLNFSIPKHGLDFSSLPFEERMRAQRWIFRYINATVSPVHKDVAIGLVDKAKVRRGREIFHGTRAAADGSFAACASCHGTYTPSGSGYVVNYQDTMEDVGADGAYMRALQCMQPVVAVINAYGKMHGGAGPKYAETYNTDKPLDAAACREGAPDVTSAAYTAPPLDGIWARAPFFHNGSVPTLRMVLRPRERPAVWARQPGASLYDYKNMGLVLARTVTDEAAKKHRKVDTSWWGYGNSGHTAQVAALADDEDLASMLEFLKCLGGKEMKPADGSPPAAVSADHPCEQPDEGDHQPAS